MMSRAYDRRRDAAREEIRSALSGWRTLNDRTVDDASLYRCGLPRRVVYEGWGVMRLAVSLSCRHYIVDGHSHRLPDVQSAAWLLFLLPRGGPHRRRAAVRHGLRIVVPTRSGRRYDARCQQRLTENLVSSSRRNRPGAGGMGMRAVAKSAADGYTCSRGHAQTR